MKQPTYSWMDHRIAPGGSPIVPGEQGILCRQPIKAGEVVMVMGGYIVDIPTHNRIGAFGERYGMDISEHFSFCPYDEEDLARMPQFLINHSCEPNCGFKDQMQIVAIRDIAADEEITYDYGFVLFGNPDNAHRFSMRCSCGSPDCRGRITVEDWKIPALHERYGKWFQPFLREKFAALQMAARLVSVATSVHG